MLDIRSKILRAVWGEELIYERHRHRYEFNNDFARKWSAAACCWRVFPRISNIVENGGDPGSSLVCRPASSIRNSNPGPTGPILLFAGLVAAAVKRRKKKALSDAL